MKSKTRKESEGIRNGDKTKGSKVDRNIREKINGWEEAGCTGIGFESLEKK